MEKPSFHLGENGFWVISRKASLSSFPRQREERGERKRGLGFVLGEFFPEEEEEEGEEERERERKLKNGKAPLDSGKKFASFEKKERVCVGLISAPFESMKDL